MKRYRLVLFPSLGGSPETAWVEREQAPAVDELLEHDAQTWRVLGPHVGEDGIEADAFDCLLVT